MAHYMLDTNYLDKLIAAHSVSLSVTLVTNNLKDFAKYPGVITENWLSAPVDSQPGSSEMEALGRKNLWTCKAVVISAPF